ncbi:DUF447 domain-containing protein [Planctomycetales bacterium 10988]|nr:DUF447 domain-containing protein [Planctomycetales bacterium 10988]
MILEGILTTQNTRGETNVAPMGPIVDEKFERLIFRPFQSSKTFINLCQTRYGVFHVTDDVELIARSALDKLPNLPPMRQTPDGRGKFLLNACRWYAFEVTMIDDSTPRSHMEAKVVDTGRLRDFWGFNRAKHAVIEAAILATRVHLFDNEDIRRELSALSLLIEKTAGVQEARAFTFLQEYIEHAIQRTPTAVS